MTSQSKMPPKTALTKAPRKSLAPQKSRVSRKAAVLHDTMVPEAGKPSRDTLSQEMAALQETDACHGSAAFHLSKPARNTSRATSYDVARLAGVSQSAVSRTFRTGGSVSTATRAKVEVAARALAYSPSQIARSLITQRSRLIGVVMTELTARNNPEIGRAHV